MFKALLHNSFWIFEIENTSYEFGENETVVIWKEEGLAG